MNISLKRQIQSNLLTTTTLGTHKKVVYGGFSIKIGIKISPAVVKRWSFFRGGCFHRFDCTCKNNLNNIVNTINTKTLVLAMEMRALCSMTFSLFLPTTIPLTEVPLEDLSSTVMPSGVLLTTKWTFEIAAKIFPASWRKINSYVIKTSLFKSLYNIGLTRLQLTTKLVSTIHEKVYTYLQ
jgi:hypothetical protein